MGIVRFRFVLAASVAAAPSWKPVARRFPGGTQRGDLINRGNLVLATRERRCKDVHRCVCARYQRIANSSPERLRASEY